MSLEWKSVTTKKNNPEAVFTCPSCKRNIFMHPNYFQCGVVLCGKCHTIPNLAKWAVEIRGGKFIKLERIKDKKRVYFICPESHEGTLDYDAIRKGATCKECKYDTQRGTNGPRTKISHKTCLLSQYPEICLELDPSNKIKPDQITPGSHKKLGWLCYNHGDIPFRYKTTARHRIKNGSGCPRCNLLGGEQLFMGHEQFVKEAREIHENRYVYNDEYKGAFVPIKIYCPLKRESNPTLDHGYFIQLPHDHKRKGRGACPICRSEQKESKLIKKIQLSLDALGIRLGKECFGEQTLKGLKYERSLRVDRAIPSENLVIEGDGGYHFQITSRGEDVLKKTQLRDLIKDQYCVKNGISLLRIPHHIDIISELISEVLSLCRSGKHVYVTYQHYYDVISKTVDMKNVHVIIIPTPK